MNKSLGSLSLAIGFWLRLSVLISTWFVLIVFVNKLLKYEPVIKNKIVNATLLTYSLCRGGIEELRWILIKLIYSFRSHLLNLFSIIIFCYID